MPVARKRVTKKKVESDSGSDNDTHTNDNNSHVDISDSSETKIVARPETASKRSKAYNAGLFKLMEAVSKGKDDFLTAVTKFETYKYENVSDLGHEYEETERENNEKTSTLQKSFAELQESLNKKHADLQESLSKKHKEIIAKHDKEHKETITKCDKELFEKKFNVDKEYREKNYELSKKYEEEKDKSELSHKKRMDEMQREKDTSALEFSLKTLKARNEVPIKESDLKEKNSKLDSMTTKHEGELKSLEKKLTDEHKKTIAHELEKKDLENKSASAKLTAKNEQQIEQIKILQGTIETLKEELGEARELTKSVAESSRQGSIVQNMGNSK
jgi:hypothetical protein